MSSNAQWEQTIGMLQGSKDWTVERLDGKEWEDKNGWDKMKFTPENSWNHMEPKNHPIEKNNYLPNLHFWVQKCSKYVNFPGCFQDNGNSERILPLTTLTKARCVSLPFFQLVQWVFTGPDLANGNGLRCDGWRQIVIPLQGRQFQKGIQPSKFICLKTCKKFTWRLLIQILKVLLHQMKHSKLNKVGYGTVTFNMTFQPKGFQGAGRAPNCMCSCACRPSWRPAKLPCKMPRYFCLQIDQGYFDEFGSCKSLHD